MSVRTYLRIKAVSIAAHAHPVSDAAFSLGKGPRSARPSRLFIEAQFFGELTKFSGIGRITDATWLRPLRLA